MSIPHVFGQFVGAHHVEAAVLNVLWKWMPTYQHEVSREAGMDPKYLQAIRSWSVVSELGRMVEAQVPAVLLVNNGVIDPPVKHADSIYLAHWEVDLGVQVVAKGAKTKATPRALTLARMQVLAMRLAIIQQRDDDGIMGMTDWRGEQPNRILEAEDDRTTCLSSTRFHITTDGTAQWGEGPLEPHWPPEPEEQPPPERPVWPVAIEHYLDIDIDQTQTPTPEEEG
jgi:hypothetical protein